MRASVLPALRSTLIMVASLAVGGSAATGCSDPEPARPDAEVDAPTDTAAEDARDTAPTGLACCDAAACPPGQRCVEGACHPAVGGAACYTATDCKPFQVCEGATLCPCGDASCTPATGTCRWPAGCCNADAECGQGERCVEGVCRADADEGCWTDAQCGPGQVCLEEVACACGDAQCAAKAGFCAIPGPCCASDRECGPEGACVDGGCVVAPGGDRCFADADCAEGLACAGAQRCACGQAGCAVPTTAGRCQGEGCCTTNADCPAGSLCVEGRACAPLPPANGCWVDEHCGPGRACVGASLCGCGEDCDAPDAPGTCRTVVTVCETSDDCGPGLRCVIPDVAYCPLDEEQPTQGVCVAEIASGCWSREDCGPQDRCGAEVICTDPAGCDAPNVPGECKAPVLEGDCCNSHLECPSGYECRNVTTFITCPPQPTAVCLPAPRLGETCWNYFDCPVGQVCNRARICACNAQCWRSREGVCEPASDQYCGSDLDCGEGATCARDLDCSANPCGNTVNCPLTGTCHEQIPGACWSHTDCASGEYCKGLRVCPPDATCDDVDKPGKCAPLGEAGDCCDSYHGCGPGLRCVATSIKSGCSLDTSAICVPYTAFNQECFATEDCAENRKCVGAKMCPCGAIGCDDPPTPGTCQLQ